MKHKRTLSRLLTAASVAQLALVCLAISRATAVASQEFKLLHSVDIVAALHKGAPKIIVHHLVVRNHQAFLAYSVLERNGNASFCVVSINDQWSVKTLLRQDDAVASAHMDATDSGDLLVIKGASLDARKSSQQVVEWLSPTGHVRVQTGFKPKVRAVASDGNRTFLLTGQNDSVYEVGPGIPTPRLSCLGTNLPRNHRIGSLGAHDGELFLFDSTQGAAIKLNAKTCQTSVKPLAGAIIARQRANYVKIVSRMTAKGTISGQIRPEFISAGTRQSTGEALLVLTGFPISDGVPVYRLDRRLENRGSYFLPPLGIGHASDKDLQSATVRGIGIRDGQTLLVTTSGTILCFAESP